MNNEVIRTYQQVLHNFEDAAFGDHHYWAEWSTMSNTARWIERQLKEVGVTPEYPTPWYHDDD